ncbi:MAG: C-type lectin domain-containing protein, partial [Verrucomicrobiota bacterium]
LNSGRWILPSRLKRSIDVARVTALFCAMEMKQRIHGIGIAAWLAIGLPAMLGGVEFFVAPPKNFADDQHEKVYGLMSDFAKREVSDATEKMTAMQKELLDSWKQKQDLAINSNDSERVMALSKMVKGIEALELVPIPAKVNSIERSGLEDYNRYAQAYQNLVLQNRISASQKYGSHLVKEKKSALEAGEAAKKKYYTAEIARVLAAVNAMKEEQGTTAESGGEGGEAKPKLQIPEGASEFDGNYYYVFDEKLTWTEAKARCENMGGYLVTILSSREHNFVTSMVARDQRYWIGLRNEEHGWRWLTGDTPTYKKWSGRPPSRQSPSGFAFLRYERWYTARDSYSSIRGFICEWESILMR